jgi:hypothetical protein
MSKATFTIAMRPFFEKYEPLVAPINEAFSSDVPGETPFLTLDLGFGDVDWKSERTKGNFVRKFTGVPPKNLCSVLFVHTSKPYRGSKLHEKYHSEYFRISAGDFKEGKLNEVSAFLDKLFELSKLEAANRTAYNAESASKMAAVSSAVAKFNRSGLTPADIELLFDAGILEPRWVGPTG